MVGLAECVDADQQQAERRRCEQGRDIVEGTRLRPAGSRQRP